METLTMSIEVKGVERYWMVHNAGSGGGAPNVKHLSRNDAEREARRLSMANRGRAFTVLEVVDAFYMPPEAPHRLPILTPRDDEVPAF